jgi:hypothetical protein
MLCSSETLEMTCTPCTQTTTHTNNVAIWSAPPVLVVQLKRFSHDDKHGTIRKAEQAIHCPFEWRVQPCVPVSPIDNDNDHNDHNNNHDDVDDVRNDHQRTHEVFTWQDQYVDFVAGTAVRDPMPYRLYGVVCHEGGLGAGHYVAYVQDHARPSQWVCMDDETVTPVPTLHMTTLFRSAYLLFYARQDTCREKEEHETKKEDEEEKKKKDEQDGMAVSASSGSTCRLRVADWSARQGTAAAATMMRTTREVEAYLRESLSAWLDDKTARTCPTHISMTARSSSSSSATASRVQEKTRRNTLSWRTFWSKPT